jgi:hypothetical protein
MTDHPETPFDSIENAQEYLRLLLEATHEALAEIEADIRPAGEEQLERRMQAMQMVSYKLNTLSSHLTTSRRILNDLRLLRRLLLEERQAREAASRI